MVAFKLLVSAGELSGDEHAANVIRALGKIRSIEAKGMGGPSLREAGVTTVVDLETSAAVMGFGDVFRAMPKITAALKTLKSQMDEWKPNAILLVDYPDFNFRLAKYAKKRHIPVIYYITPQLWAWRKGRAAFLSKYVDKAAVIFPFERPFLESQGFKRAVFVGHPFCDELMNIFGEETRADFRERFLPSLGLRSEEPVLAVFPGSRPGEIKRHLPKICTAFSLLKKKHPEVQGIIPVARPVAKLFKSNKIKLPDGLIQIPEHSLEILACADAGLLKSGTCNLQAAFLGLPFAMFFQAPLLSEFIVKMFVKISQFSIVNVLRSGTVPELLQREATPELIAEKLEQILFDKLCRARMQTAFKEIVETLSSHDDIEIFDGCTSSAERVAKLVIEASGGQS